MPSFSANLGFLWSELSIPQRIYAAKEAGFEAVELHWPFETDSEELRIALVDTDLKVLSLNTPPGDLGAGDFGLSAVEGKQAIARQSIDQAIDYAQSIAAFNVHVMAGVTDDDKKAMTVFENNLDYAADKSSTANLGIVIEPINRFDRPGYALYKIDQAVEIIDNLKRRKGHTNIGLMFDCYHVQMTEGKLAEKLNCVLPYITHIQIAAVPGRAEPDQGEINYPWLFNYIDNIGYTGYVGAEYIPATTTAEGLDWFQPYRQ